MHLARTFTRAKCLAARREASSRGVRPRSRHGRARKLGAGGHVRFLVNAQCVGVPAVHAALLLAAPPALSHLLRALHAPLCCENVYNVRRPTYDGAGAYVTRRHTRRYVHWLAGTRWISRQRDRAVREGKQLPAVVMMRGGGRRRCTWSADAASGLSARVLEDKTVQEMGWPGRREGRCMGCGWDMVVVVYVGETVHVRTPQLQAPTHRPQDLSQMS